MSRPGTPAGCPTTDVEGVPHVAGTPQRWPDADADIRGWVAAATGTIQGLLGSQLVATYLHGSLAMGSFYRPKSDVDLLVVAERPLARSLRRELAVALLSHLDACPTIGGLELSVVDAAAAARFDHPQPYEFHFSEKWVDDIRAGGAGPVGEDPDLAAHFAATRQRGVALFGPAPKSVLGPVPPEAFRAAVLDDLAWIIDENGIHESPFYAVLNCCRFLQGLEVDFREVHSKEEGGLWALEHLPDTHRSVVRQALDCYRSDALIAAAHRQTHGHRWDHEALDRFKEFVRPAASSAAD